MRHWRTGHSRCSRTLRFARTSARSGSLRLLLLPCDLHKDLLEWQQDALVHLESRHQS